MVMHRGHPGRDSCAASARMKDGVQHAKRNPHVGLCFEIAFACQAEVEEVAGAAEVMEAVGTVARKATTLKSPLVDFMCVSYPFLPFPTGPFAAAQAWHAPPCCRNSLKSDQGGRIQAGQDSYPGFTTSDLPVSAFFSLHLAA